VSGWAIIASLASQYKRFDMKKITGVLLLAVALSASSAYAQQDHSGHGGQSGHGAASIASSPASKAYEAANAKMHQDMDVKFSGDADADFVRGMIPHHQGAVDMAKIVLQHGKDPDVKKLAQDVIASQEKEITWMKDWLAKNNK
jgi:uncharacterized protein (DUF305 family)